MPIGRSAHHAAVAVAQSEDPPDAQLLRRAGQLMQTQVAHRGEAAQHLRRHVAHLAIGGADQVGSHPPAGIVHQGGPQAERFVIRVGEDGQQPPFRRRWQRR